MEKGQVDFQSPEGNLLALVAEDEIMSLGQKTSIWNAVKHKNVKPKMYK